MAEKINPWKFALIQSIAPLFLFIFYILYRFFRWQIGYRLLDDSPSVYNLFMIDTLILILGAMIIAFLISVFVVFIYNKILGKVDLNLYYIVLIQFILVLSYSIFVFLIQSYKPVELLLCLVYILIGSLIACKFIFLPKKVLIYTFLISVFVISILLLIGYLATNSPEDTCFSYFGDDPPFVATEEQPLLFSGMIHVYPEKRGIKAKVNTPFSFHALFYAHSGAKDVYIQITKCEESLSHFEGLTSLKEDIEMPEGMYWFNSCLTVDIPKNRNTKAVLGKCTAVVKGLEKEYSNEILFNITE